MGSGAPLDVQWRRRAPTRTGKDVGGGGAFDRSHRLDTGQQRGDDRIASARRLDLLGRQCDLERQKVRRVEPARLVDEAHASRQGQAGRDQQGERQRDFDHHESLATPLTFAASNCPPSAFAQSGVDIVRDALIAGKRPTSRPTAIARTGTAAIRRLSSRRSFNLRHIGQYQRAGRREGRLIRSGR